MAAADDAANEWRSVAAYQGHGFLEKRSGKWGLKPADGVLIAIHTFLEERPLAAVAALGDMGRQVRNDEAGEAGHEEFARG